MIMRYEQEDEWNEFLERTDTSKVPSLGASKGGYVVSWWGLGLVSVAERSAQDVPVVPSVQRWMAAGYQRHEFLGICSPQTW